MSDDSQIAGHLSGGEKNFTERDDGLLAFMSLKELHERSQTERNNYVLLKSILQELHDLKSPKKIEPPEETTSNFVWTTLLQVFALALAAVFGVFSILSWKVGLKANGMTETAHKIALFSFCYSNRNEYSPAMRLSSTNSFLVQQSNLDGYKLINAQGLNFLQDLAIEYFKASPPTSPQRGGGLETSSIIAIMAGLLGLFGTFIALYYHVRDFFRDRNVKTETKF